MSYNHGNKFAERWTEQTATELVEKVYNYCAKNKENYHLGLALIECGAYPDLWAYLTDKFIENENVLRAIKKVEQYLEARIVNSTMSGTAKSAAMAIFYLKNKHGYNDRTETDLTTRGKEINTSNVVLPEGQTMEDFKREMQDILNGGN